MGAIIWLASYPKSGNTWMRSFLHNLLMNPPRPVPINELNRFCLGESGAAPYAARAGKPYEDISPEEIARLRPLVHMDFTRASPDSVFVKTHNYLGTWFDQPLHNMDVTAGGIYILRNPLDVALSVTHHYSMSLDQAIERLATVGVGTDTGDGHVPEVHSSWSHHVASWTAAPNPQLLVLRYEDMLEQPQIYFRKTAEFLGLNPPQERLDRAIRFSSFKSLKEQEEQEGFRERPKKAQSSFFREGRSEQWREVLSPAQIRRIISDHREQMERFDYIPKDYA
ncbi:MAG: sulfotransferase domain-containing protein [Parvibaculum sp.]|uniref:sulfotransferase domain-containing protein n=1 Tax=Parvibaculum sp. TaxID=2024848 RepID=UPI003C742EF2